jgi:hypothetical protein
MLNVKSFQAKVFICSPVVFLRDSWLLDLQRILGMREPEHSGAERAFEAAGTPRLEYCGRSIVLLARYCNV